MPEVRDVQVTAMMTAPRLEIVAARSYIELALRAAGVPLVVSGGVFYGQCMQRMLQDAINSGADIALTVDFDSLFTAKDIMRLLETMVRNDIDAVASLQVRRGKLMPLFTRAAQRMLETDGITPVRVDTAHFGLTAINLKKLAFVPKPWFWSTPNVNGEWEGDKIDDDVYFWHKWKEAGLSLYIDPTVRIGHMEEMVVMYDEQLKPKHYYTWEWEKIAYHQTDGTLVFIGANRPDDKLQAFVRKHRRAYLFEPLPEAATELRSTFYEDRGVTVIQAACADGDQRKGILHRYNTNGMSSSLGTVTQQARDVFKWAEFGEGDELEVWIYNLADYCIENDIVKIDYLIIDAQGMDLTILKTMHDWLRDGLISHIQIEVDGEGFQHYDGLPSDREQDALEYMAQFPHYVAGRVENCVKWNPDLTFTLCHPGDVIEEQEPETATA